MHRLSHLSQRATSFDPEPQSPVGAQVQPPFRTALMVVRPGWSGAPAADDAAQDDSAATEAPVSVAALQSAGSLSLTVRAHAVGRVTLIEASGRGVLNPQSDRALNGIMALILLDGSGTVRQGDAASLMRPGDVCLLHSEALREVRAPGAFRVALVEVPAGEFAARFPHWARAAQVPLRGTGGTAAVFRDLVASLSRWHGTLDPTLGEGMADSVIALMGALVCAALPTRQDCPHPVVSPRDRIKKIAQLNLSNPELDVDFLAAEVGLSPRQVHRLFAEEGTSVMRWVLVQRLERCHEAIAAGDLGGRPLSDVAYRWGFNDQAHFSRAFRKHFGLSPRDLRRQGPAAIPVVPTGGLPEALYPSYGQPIPQVKRREG